MQYRVAYDVLQEWYDLRLSLLMLIPFLFTVVFTLLIGCACLYELRTGDRSARRRGHPLLGLVIAPILVLCFGWLVCRPILPQWRARAWARAGDGEVVEGTVSGLGHGRKGSTYFTVAGVSFRYLPWNSDDAGGGFRGTFTDPAVPADALRDGVPVRVTHYGDCILRIEIAEPPAGAPGGGGQPP
jgi:hypothetical protein